MKKYKLKPGVIPEPSEKKELKISKEYLRNVKVSDLKPYDRNYLNHKKNVTHIKNSLSKFGMIKTSIVVDEKNILLSGHGTLSAINQLNWALVPSVERITGLTEKQKKAYRIADNVSSHAAQQDEMILVDELKGLEEFNLESMGLKLNKKIDNNVDGDVEFSEELLEEHNYVVLYFENKIDWLNFQSLYPLQTKKALDSKPRYEKMGIGRVIKGADFLKKFSK